MSRSRLYLVDGSSYLYRAFHALPPLSNAAGEPTGAMFGVVNMIRRLRAAANGAHIAVVFDAPGPTFRDELFRDYKAQRPPMPPDLRSQIAPLLEIVRALGLPLLRVPGVEADDVIATLVERARAAGCEVVISSSDKDLAQLVGDGVVLEDTMHERRLDREGVIAKFGVPPERIVDYLALVGDTADNVPGVPKCGPKTAAKWLAEYDSLDGVIANATNIGGKIGESLRASLDQLPLSRELVTLKRDVELELGIDELKIAPADVEALRGLYRRYEFKAALRELEPQDGSETAPDSGSNASEESQPAPQPPEAERDYDTVLDPAAFDAWVRRLEAAELICIDTETDGLDAQQCRLVGLSFAVEPGRAAYVPLAHDYPGAPAQLPAETVLGALRPLLEDPARAKLGQHAKFDINVLARHGIALRGLRHDSMLASYVLDSTATRHDMDSLARHYLGIGTISYSDVAGKGSGQLSFNEIPLEQAAPYAAEDADVTLRLQQALWPRIKATPALRSVYEDIEIPLVPVLARMEQRGVLVDVELLRTQSRELNRRMVELRERAHALAGRSFSLDSPKQLQALLFDELGLPVTQRTPKGQPSTNEEALHDLAPRHPLPQLILDYRSLAKLVSTYTDRLPEQLNPHTGRVHTSYHQAVAATGRLSSSDPNLQNIPIRTEEGRRIRQAFIAPEGWCIVAADYSQIELRIMAHLSEDPGLLAAFQQELDVHRATAAEVFGVTLDEVSGEQRRAAKAINFGLMYGMSAFGLARQLGIDRGEAQRYIDRYFQRYPGVQAYMERIRGQARQHGWVETVFGRRLYLPEIQARNVGRRQGAERAAINAPMQGTAADIIKRAMLAVDAWLEDGSMPARMIMQVHDELVFEVREDAVDTLVDGVRQRMAAAAELRVPLRVDVGQGSNWDQAH